MITAAHTRLEHGFSSCDKYSCQDVARITWLNTCWFVTSLCCHQDIQPHSTTCLHNAPTLQLRGAHRPLHTSNPSRGGTGLVCQVICSQHTASTRQLLTAQYAVLQLVAHPTGCWQQALHTDTCCARGHPGPGGPCTRTLGTYVSVGKPSTRGTC